MHTESKKQCAKCKKILSTEFFYGSPSTKDGLMYKCKECTKAAARRNRRKRIDYYREYDRKRYMENGSRGEATPDAKRRAKRSWAKRNPEKRAAQLAVGRAIRDGRLDRQPCCVCGSPNSQAHHEDYSRPLDVIWLCSEHHAIHHRIEEQIARTYGMNN